MPLPATPLDRAQTRKPSAGLIGRFLDWRNDLISKPSFQAWAARTPIVRQFAKRDGEKLYDLLAGFVYSQTLLASVECGLLEALKDGPRDVDELAARCDLPIARMRQLCQAASSVGLLSVAGDASYRLGRLGAAFLGVPGLDDMVRHHKVFYRDIADPLPVLKGEAETELSQFWPYVFGGSERQPDVARAYSDLMATSQVLVAEETLRAFAFDGASHVMDVGGGNGAFLAAVANRHPGLGLTLFDLPDVAAEAQERFDAMALKAEAVGGSFREDALPQGADVISLVRVCYDHNDDTVEQLLASVHGALPKGGRIVISEPMSGGAQPTRPGDAYFGFYTRAMTTGRPRSLSEHGAALERSGFKSVTHLKTARPFITSVIVAQK